MQTDDCRVENVEVDLSAASGKTWRHCATPTSPGGMFLSSNVSYNGGGSGHDRPGGCATYLP